MQCVGEAFAKQDGELIGGLLPRHRRHLPIFLNVAQGQIQQFAGRFIGRKVPPILEQKTLLPVTFSRELGFLKWV